VTGEVQDLGDDLAPLAGAVRSVALEQLNNMVDRLPAFSSFTIWRSSSGHNSNTLLLVATMSQLG
jgi:hypothetical protein